MTRIAIDRLDHFVLTVVNIDATCAFYKRVLGMEAVNFGPGRVALSFVNLALSPLLCYLCFVNLAFSA